jgi:hypothetical protein
MEGTGVRAPAMEGGGGGGSSTTVRGHGGHDPSTAASRGHGGHRGTAASPCFVSRSLPRPPHHPLGLPPSWAHLHQVDGAAAPVPSAGGVAPLRINDGRPHARRLEAGGLASAARVAAMGFERRPAARGEEERVTTDLPWGELRW